MKELKGICHICGRLAMKTCIICGRPTCDKDLDPKLGICVSCKQGRMIKK